MFCVFSFRQHSCCTKTHVIRNAYNVRFTHSVTRAYHCPVSLQQLSLSTMATENFCEKSVVNISDFVLNEHHVSLLTRGLKFCPTPPGPNPGQLREDMDRFHTRMRQIAFFENRESFLDQSTSSICATPVATPTNVGSKETIPT